MTNHSRIETCDDKDRTIWLYVQSWISKGDRTNPPERGFDIIGACYDHMYGPDLPDVEFERLQPEFDKTVLHELSK